MRYDRISEEQFKVIAQRVRSGKPHGTPVAQATAHRPASSPPFAPFQLALTGQLPSGKTSGVKEGYRNDGSKYRYPNKRFTNWRAEALVQLLEQQSRPIQPLAYPVSLTCDYWPGDHRTRDVSGMLDALFHLLGKAGVLKDDGLIYNVTWRRHDVNQKFPKVVMELEAWHP